MESTSLTSLWGSIKAKLSPLFLFSLNSCTGTELSRAPSEEMKKMSDEKDYVLNALNNSEVFSEFVEFFSSEIKRIKEFEDPSDLELLTQFTLLEAELCHKLGKEIIKELIEFLS